MKLIGIAECGKYNRAVDSVGMFQSVLGAITLTLLRKATSNLTLVEGAGSERSVVIPINSAMRLIMAQSPLPQIILTLNEKM